MCWCLLLPVVQIQEVEREILILSEKSDFRLDHSLHMVIYEAGKVMLSFQKPCVLVVL